MGSCFLNNVQNRHFPLILIDSFVFKGLDKSSIFEGGIFVDLSFTSIERNGNKINQLDDKKKKDIENVLIDEFCSLDVKSQAESNTCSVQNLEFRVHKDNQLWNVLDFLFLQSWEKGSF